MAVVVFWGNSEKETGQTISTIAVATMMAIEHNYKILAVSTGFKDTTMEDSFWTTGKINIQKQLGLENGTRNMESGIEGLSRVLQSNRGRSGLIPDYARVVFKDRLDVIQSPQTEEFNDYIEISKVYPALLEIANMDYNLVIVDVDKRLPGQIQKEILQKADVIVLNTNQGLKNIENVAKLRKNNEIFHGENVMILLGRYDKFSKYNVKNITRYLKERRPISAISYNTLFFEATTEGKVADYFLRYRNLTDKTDRNAVFIQEARKTCDNIINMIEDVQKRR